MKQKILFLAAFILLSLPHSFAQVSATVNLSRQPAWGPVGYDYVENYYIPDINVYYNVPQGLFVYNDRGRWIGTRQVPASYRNFDLFKAYKVVINSPDPWKNHEQYYTLYSRYRPCSNQVALRDMDPQFFKVRSFSGYRAQDLPYEQQPDPVIRPHAGYCGACQSFEIQKEIANDSLQLQPQPRNPNE